MIMIELLTVRAKFNVSGWGHAVSTVFVSSNEYDLTKSVNQNNNC